MTREQVGALVVAVVAPMISAAVPQVRAFYSRKWQAIRHRWPTTAMLIKEFSAQAATYHAETQSRLDTQDEALALLRHEVLPNNGGSLRDAVDRIAIEGRQQRARLSARVELKDRGQFEITPDGLVDWSNEALRFYVGQPESVIKGRTWLAMFDRADRDRLSAELQQIEFDRASAKVLAKLRRIIPATDTGGGRVELIDVELSVSVVPEPDAPKKVHCYSFTVRKVFPTGQQPAMPPLRPNEITGDGS